MKVLHVCLASFYIDNFSYQENLIPKYHKQLGLEVEILASLFTFDKNGRGVLLENSCSYINEYGIPVTRLQYKKSITNRQLRQYKGTFEAITKANPDIIFIHGCQFLDIKYVIKYVVKNPKVKVYVDNHADFSNSATNWLSKNILHRIIWRYCANLIEPYTEKFYGVMPSRVDFLMDIYKVPENKVKLLLMGADDEKVKEARNKEIRNSIRKIYNIKPDDFLIMTGGKVDNAKKQTLLLMKAVQQLEMENVKLIVFGSVVKELQSEINLLSDGNRIQYVGWISAEDTYKYFSASDLVVFPGRHSVFWEQVTGIGIPMVVKYWPGTTHIDVGGNCKFLYHDSEDELSQVITNIVNNSSLYRNMKDIAEKEGIKKFSYMRIAKESIEQF